MPFVDSVRVTPACRNTRFGGASVVKHIVIKLTLSDVFIFMASSTCNAMQHMLEISTSAATAAGVTEVFSTEGHTLQLCMCAFFHGGVAWSCYRPHQLLTTGLRIIVLSELLPSTFHCTLAAEHIPETITCHEDKLILWQYCV